MKTGITQSRRLLSIIAAPLISILSTSSPAQDYPVFRADDIVVTANRTPTAFAELTRNVTVISSDDITRFPVNNINDLLEYVSAVDVVQRGAEGIQADVSIRGCSYEQTLILVDGIKVNDPQTGHHNMNLPLILSDIDRIEVLKGHGSRLFGPGAFGGAINIITKKQTGKSAEANITAGDFRYGEGNVSLVYPLSSLDNHISFSKRKSDGYRKNTEFDIYNAYFSTSYGDSLNKIDIAFGHTDKKFGANSFYSDIFPNEWEHTRLYFLNMSYQNNFRASSFSPGLFWRRHEDDFVLDRDRPDWYRNKHNTGIYGFEIKSVYNSKYGITAIGGEFVREEISGNSLNDHLRSRSGLFLEQNIDGIEPFILALGTNACYYSEWGWTISPGIDAGCLVTDNLKLYSSIGRSFRVPTFTELYYQSPANAGDENLKPEESISYETGLTYTRKPYFTKISLFLQDGNNLIDWVRENDSSPWKARNISSILTGGFEYSFELYPDVAFHNLRFSGLRISYSYLDSDRKTADFESKYVLNYLRHQLQSNINIGFSEKISNSWMIRYEDRVNGKSYSIFDTRFRWLWKSIKIHFDITNLFDTDYEDISSIPMPGRWLRLGITYSISSR
ncbi:MAG: TonB-dependent receptor [Candidatus Zixiibacteriota bacterium]|nr:MAG: TonB-dependent receptor [candidate division Zixibacteria bacterium]